MRVQSTVPRTRILKWHLREHGVGSLLSSTKLGQFSGCVLDDLLEAGAKIVESSVEATKQVPSSESVDDHEAKQADSTGVKQSAKDPTPEPRRYTRKS